MAAEKAQPAIPPHPVKPETEDKVITPIIPDGLPTKIRLNVQYGFYDTDGSLKMWSEGQVIDDQEHINILFNRRIDFEDLS